MKKGFLLRDRREYQASLGILWAQQVREEEAKDFAAEQKEPKGSRGIFVPNMSRLCLHPEVWCWPAL